MTAAASETSTLHNRPLRLWPGVVIVLLQWLLRFGLPVVLPGMTAAMVGVIGSLLCGVGVLVWWGFFSRADRTERWGGVLAMLVGLLVASQLVHESIATGMMGMMFVVYSIPVLSLAFVLWAVIFGRLPARPRRLTMVASVLLACGFWTLLRFDGMSGQGTADLSWRWSKTPEERLLARAEEPRDLPGAAPSSQTGPQWPGFRGPHRDGAVRAVELETDWSTAPPVELWRRPVGPGWSSFAVQGDLFFTQEQRGEEEVVSCYRTITGEPVWRHGDTTRFWEANAGAGPRATPTLSEGRVYTFGATGVLNVLEAGDGTVVWSRDVAEETDSKIPYWGFSASPLVVEDLVLVAAGGQLVAYERETGVRRWLGKDGGASYSSPHLATIGGVPQVLLLSAAGAVSVLPADGHPLWEHAWPGYPIVQPALTAEGDVLLGVDQESGLRRLGVANGSGGWTVEERWTSNRLKPYFNDFVVHEGHAYGFDGRILACIDVEDGERRWKGGRYGHGQLLLLPDQDLLLVLSEEGELALVGATPDGFTELARHPAIEGKTWNHPVLAGDVLLVRNDREMAAFRLPLAPATSESTTQLTRGR